MNNNEIIILLLIIFIIIIFNSNNNHIRENFNNEEFTERDYVVYPQSTNLDNYSNYMGELEQCFNICSQNVDCVGFSRKKDISDNQVGECIFKKNMNEDIRIYNDSNWKSYEKLSDMSNNQSTNPSSQNKPSPGQSTDPSPSSVTGQSSSPATRQSSSPATRQSTVQSTGQSTYQSTDPSSIDTSIIEQPDFFSKYGLKDPSLSFELNGWTLASSVETIPNEGLASILTEDKPDKMSDGKPRVAGFKKNHLIILIGIPEAENLISVEWFGVFTQHGNARNAKNVKLYGSNNYYRDDLTKARQEKLLSKFEVKNNADYNDPSIINIINISKFKYFYFDISDSWGDSSVKIDRIKLNF
jgi:hypothetical protein